MPDMSDPVHLPDPGVRSDPEPAAGCDVCAACARQREAARAKGDESAAIDRNIEIRGHPHGPVGA